MVIYEDDIYSLTYYSMSMPFNAALLSAVNELQNKIKAVGIPTPPAIMSAPDGTVWEGNTSDGKKWKLTKNNAESYNCEPI